MMNIQREKYYIFWVKHCFFAAPKYLWVLLMVYGLVLYLISKGIDSLHHQYNTFTLVVLAKNDINPKRLEQSLQKHYHPMRIEKIDTSLFTKTLKNENILKTPEKLPPLPQGWYVQFYYPSALSIFKSPKHQIMDMLTSEPGVASVIGSPFEQNSILLVFLLSISSISILCSSFILYFWCIQSYTMLCVVLHTLITAHIPHVICLPIAQSIKKRILFVLLLCASPMAYMTLRIFLWFFV